MPRAAKNPVTGFGVAPVKIEGEAFQVDPGAGKMGGKRGVNTRWMELPVRDNQGRASVHKMVDKWLDERAAGPAWKKWATHEDFR